MREYIKVNQNRFIVEIGIAFVLYFICYGAGFFDNLYNYDSVSWSYEMISRTQGGGVSVGRFMRNPWTLIFSGGLVIPQVKAIITFSAMMVTSYSLIKLFNIKDFISRLLIMSSVITFPIIAIYWEFGNDIMTYSIAISLSVITIILLKSNKFTYKALSAIPLILALGTYQSVLSIITGVFAIAIIDDILDDRIEIKQTLINFVILIVSSAVYFLIAKGLATIFVGGFQDYRGLGEFSLLNPILTIPNSIKNSYDIIWNLFTLKLDYFSEYYYFYLTLPIMGLTILAPLLLKKTQRFLYLLALIIYPIFLNSTYFVTQEYAVRLLLSLILIPITVIVIIKYCSIPKLKYLLLTVVIVFNFASMMEVTNVMTLFSKRVETDTMVVNKIYFDLLEQPDFTAESPVLFCGDLEQNTNMSYSNDNPFIYEPSVHTNPGATGMLWRGADTAFNDFTYKRTIGSVFKQNSYSLNLISGECEPAETEFPKPGYITYNGAYYTVNLSKVTNDQV